MTDMPDDIQLKLQAIKIIQDFCKWMIIVQGGLLATYVKWISSGVLMPSRNAKLLTLVGFGGALVLASLRLGFLASMTERLHTLGKSDTISGMSVSHNPNLERVVMPYFGVPQHLLFLIGIVGFALSAWNLAKPNTENRMVNTGEQDSDANCDTDLKSPDSTLKS